jgi:hypothetical protein
VQKTDERRSPAPPAVPMTAALSRGDAFAADCTAWLVTRAESGIVARPDSGDGRLLAVFDVLGDWLDGGDPEAASVLSAVRELHRRHPVGRVVARQVPRIRAIVVGLALQAGLRDVDEFAESWHILLRGALQNAFEGDAAAPARARAMAGDLIARHRAHPTGGASSYDAESEFGWVEADTRPRSAPSPRTAGGGDTDLDWFDVYGWDGALTPVTYPA